MYVSYHRDSLTSDNVTEIAVSLGFSAVVIEVATPVCATAEDQGFRVAFDWVKGGFEATDIRFLELGSRAASHYDDF